MNGYVFKKGGELQLFWCFFVQGVNREGAAPCAPSRTRALPTIWSKAAISGKVWRKEEKKKLNIHVPFPIIGCWKEGKESVITREKHSESQRALIPIFIFEHNRWGLGVNYQSEWEWEWERGWEWSSVLSCESSISPCSWKADLEGQIYWSNIILFLISHCDAAVKKPFLHFQLQNCTSSFRSSQGLCALGDLIHIFFLKLASPTTP